MLASERADLLERTRLEDKLRQSEDRSKGLFDDAPVACHELDWDGVVVRVNRAECDLLGFEPAGMLGRHIWDFMAPHAQETGRQALRRMVSSGLAAAPFEREYTRQDGTTLVLEVHPKLIRDPAGSVVGVRSFTFDITERKRAERALQKRARELARSNGELEQFAYVASHDLQEPLRKILAFGDRLKTRCADALGTQGSEDLARMQNAAARMQALIQDLLSLSRVASHAQPFAPVDLAEVARTVVSDLGTRMEQAGARVEVGPLPVIIADRGQMTQLFQNLIANGLKFHKPGEAPVVKVRGELASGSGGFADLCQIFIEDNGIGFDQKYAERIFQVFQRLHGRQEYEGTGIGLAICRKIVERHNGSLTASGQPGKGAKFVVTLPYRPPTQETHA